MSVQPSADDLDCEERWRRRINQSSAMLAENVTPTTLAEEFGDLEGYVASELCNEAVMIAVGEGRGELELEDFHVAHDIVTGDDQEDNDDRDDVESQVVETSTDVGPTDDTVEGSTDEAAEPDADDNAVVEQVQSPDVSEMDRNELETEVTELRDQVDELEADLKQHKDETKRELAFVRQTFVKLFDMDGVTDPEDYRDGALTLRDSIDGVQEQQERHQQQLASISDIGEKKTSKEEKIAALVTFADRQRDADQEKVGLTTKEMQGATGISRKYAYDLVDQLHADDDYPWASDASQRDVHLEQSTPERGLLIDFSLTGVQHDGMPLNKFNNEIGGKGGE